MSRRNRRSQALFVCISCGHRGNADAIAAENIRRAAVNQPDVTGIDVSRAYILKNDVPERSSSPGYKPTHFRRGVVDRGHERLLAEQRELKLWKRYLTFSTDYE